MNILCLDRYFFIHHQFIKSFMKYIIRLGIVMQIRSIHAHTERERERCICTDRMHHLLNRIRLPFQSLYTLQKCLRPSNFFSMQELLSAPTASPAAALGSIDCQNSDTADGMGGRVTSFACRLFYCKFL